VPRLVAAGLELEPLSQGLVSLSAPTKELERLVVKGRVRHGGHQVLRWMAANATAKTDDNGNVRLQKPHGNSPLKVEGISAAVNAVSAWIGDVGGNEEFVSVYERRGVTSVSLDGADEDEPDFDDEDLEDDSDEDDDDED